MFRSPAADLIVIIVVLLLIVGPRKLPQMGQGLGYGLRGFKDGITGAKDKNDDPNTQSLTQANAVPTAGPADDHAARTAGAPSRETGSEPGA